MIVDQLGSSLTKAHLPQIKQTLVGWRLGVGRCCVSNSCSCLGVIEKLQIQGCDQSPSSYGTANRLKA